VSFASNLQEVQTATAWDAAMILFLIDHLRASGSFLTQPGIFLGGAVSVGFKVWQGN